jgi:hypothetical protein
MRCEAWGFVFWHEHFVFQHTRAPTSGNSYNLQNNPNNYLKLVNQSAVIAVASLLNICNTRTGATPAAPSLKANDAAGPPR